MNGHEWNPGALSNIIQPDCIRQLNHLIQATDCKFVLTSAWRYMLLKTADCEQQMTLHGFEYLMRTHGTIGFRRLGTTASDEAFGWTMENKKPVRGEQILTWLAAVTVRRYIAIDDEDDGITAAGIPLVQTNGKTGLCRKKADEAIRLLAGGAPLR